MENISKRGNLNIGFRCVTLGWIGVLSKSILTVIPAIKILILFEIDDILFRYILFYLRFSKLFIFGNINHLINTYYNTIKTIKNY